MFQDIDISRDIMRDFKLHCNMGSHLSIQSSSPLGKRFPHITVPRNNYACRFGLMMLHNGTGSVAHDVSIVPVVADFSSGVIVDASNPVEASIQTLTTGYWPTFLNTDALILPVPMLGIMDRFDKFYCNKYQGRRLSWAHSLARCIVTARFLKGKKELDLSFLQGLVLLCFNKTDRMSLANIRHD